MTPEAPLELIIELNKIDPPGRVVMFAVPSRILRIIDPKGDWMTFHVQQLQQRGSALGALNVAWRDLSIHQGQQPGQALQPAADALKVAQKKLMEEVRAEGQRRAAITNKLVTS